MLQINGYDIGHKIAEGPKTSVYSARRHADGLEVAIKVVRPELATRQDYHEFEREREILEAIPGDGVLRVIELASFSGQTAMVYEYGGTPLSLRLASGPLPLDEFLKIAYDLAGILSAIHRVGIVHKDIKPSNIFVHPRTGKVKLANFSIAQILKHEIFVGVSSSGVEGTPAYMAPEQTGRMNRPMDYRADFYSLGAAFYEMLTGAPPFVVNDLMELIHAHIAKLPASPIEQNPAIPPIVEAIILKLLAKNAEDRYRSGYGLAADLEKCRDGLNQGAIPEFTLGEQDISEKLNIPQKLYGRQKELQTLLAAMDRVSFGISEMVIVAGYSGIGKTSLVHEVERTVFEHGGFFIEGKFELMKRDIPYSAIITALRDLMRRILVLPRESLEEYKDAITNALDPNARLIIDVIPEVEHIIGVQPPVPQLGPAESRNRFNQVFQDFLGVLGRPGTPLVIFIDDWQNVDSASLDMIHTISTGGEIKYILFLGAYRMTEVGQDHPFHLFMEKIKRTDLPVTQITLAPLGFEEITALMGDMLGDVSEETAAAAELILAKTGGNPFFVNQFIRRLYEEDILYFNPEARRWQWHLAQIADLDITENVVDLLVEKINRLPDEVQNIMRLGSCVGHRFDANLLSGLRGESVVTTLSILADAIQEGMLAPVTDSFALGDMEKVKITSEFRFLHDRIQEAAHSLLSEEESRRIHLKIGRMLLQKTSEDDLDERIFEIVHQLNKTSDLLDDQEKHRLIRFNMMAGAKAKASAAFHQAAEYFTVAKELLPANVWSEDYDRAFILHREMSECEYLAGRHEKAEILFDEVLAHTRSELDRAGIANIRMLLYATAGRFVENNRLAVQTLRELGLDLPETGDATALKQEMEKEFVEYRRLLGDRKIADLIHTPEMTDPEKRMCMNLMMNMASSAYVSNPPIVPLVAVKMVNLSLCHGMMPTSPYGLSVWGLVLGGRFGDYQGGYEFGLLALALNERFADPSLRANVPFIIGNFINHWNRHIRINMEFLRQSYLAGIEIGDYVYGSFAATSIPRVLLSYGHDHLEDVREEIEQTFAFFRRTRNQASLERQEVLRHTVLNLLGRTSDRLSLNHGDFDETAHIEKMKSIQYGTGIALYYFYKCFILYTYGAFFKALALAKEAVAHLPFIVNSMQEADATFYYSLCLTALYPQMPSREQEESLGILQQNQNRMATWMVNCPENFTGRYHLLVAEIGRIQGDDLSALDHYELAIDASKEQGFLSLNALAYELTARFHIDRKRKTAALGYLLAAVDAYRRWGAWAKVKSLEEDYPELLRDSRRKDDKAGDFTSLSKDTFVDKEGQSAGLCETIDFLSVVRSSQAISGEIVLDRLIQTLMRIVVENAGAQSGRLLLLENDQCIIRARSTMEKRIQTQMAYTALETSDDLPVSVIQYILRTGESVVLGDAIKEGLFTADSYLQQHQIKSICGLPLYEQAEMMGIFYLENQSVHHVFTPERMEILKLLCSQAAISLRNALNWEELNQTKETLRISEEEYRVLFENLQDFFYRADNQGNIVMISPSVYKILGYTPKEAVGLNLARDVYHDPSQRGRFLEALEEKGFVEDYEVQLKKKDGTVIWISTNSHFYDDRQGKRQGVEGMVRDITSRKQAEETVRQLNEDLEKRVEDRTRELNAAIKELEAFSYTVSHDLRAPLRAIDGLAEIVEEDHQEQLPPEGRELLGLIRKNTRKMGQLIDDLLQFSRLGRNALNRTRTEPTDLVRQILEELASQINSRPIDLSVDSMPSCHADPALLRIAYMNMITNALKFTQNREKARIEIGSYQEGEQCVYFVRDNGAGFDMQYANKVFDVFQRLHREEDYPGTGIGMSLVQRIIQRHGGRIWVEAEVEQGAAFFFTLRPQ